MPVSVRKGRECAEGRSQARDGQLSPVQSTSRTTRHDFRRFPTTRYQGSKRKLAGSIIELLADVEYETALDAFGGTGAMAYAFKCLDKAVTYNDLLAFNHQIGLALIENDRQLFSEEMIDFVCTEHSGVFYDDVVDKNFAGIYFHDCENQWIDRAVANIRAIKGRYFQAIAWFALFQACIAKRPFNLFHRKNLYLRTADVKRSFGNKVTWDKPFEEHFRNFTAQANRAIIDSGGRCRSIRSDVMAIDPTGFELVYIDPPYISQSRSAVDYRDYYHFLEGLVRYDDWPAMIDCHSKHRRLRREPDLWSDPRTCEQMFGQLFRHFSNSILAVSYRSDGIPSIDRLREMLTSVKRTVQVVDNVRYQYVLSKKRSTRQVLLIGR